MVSNLRRRSMLEEPSSGEEETALYPLMTYAPQVTNGNHINLDVSGGKGLNLTNYSRSASIDRQPTWFTVPAGSTGVLKIKNIKLSRGGYAFNFRRANGNSSHSWGTGNLTSDDDVEVSYTPTEDANIGCLFIYSSGNYLTIECDIYFYVDGVRYI